MSMIYMRTIVTTINLQIYVYHHVVICSINIEAVNVQYSNLLILQDVNTLVSLIIAFAELMACILTIVTVT